MPNSNRDNAARPSRCRPSEFADNDVRGNKAGDYSKPEQSSSACNRSPNYWGMSARILDDLEHEVVTYEAGHSQAGPESGGHVPARPDGQTPPSAAVDHARSMLNIERMLENVSDSLFDTIVANEIGPATTLATNMLGDFRAASAAVHRAFENARADFSTYDGNESPRCWVLRYVAEETLRSSMQDCASSGDDESPLSGPGDSLQSLEPESRLAVILIDALGMTEEAAARICKTEVETFRERVEEARKKTGDE